LPRLKIHWKFPDKNRDQYLKMAEEHGFSHLFAYSGIWIELEDRWKGIAYLLHSDENVPDLSKLTRRAA